MCSLLLNINSDKIECTLLYRSLNNNILYRVKSQYQMYSTYNYIPAYEKKIVTTLIISFIKNIIIREKVITEKKLLEIRCLDRIQMITFMLPLNYFWGYHGRKILNILDLWKIIIPQIMTFVDQTTIYYYYFFG